MADRSFTDEIDVLEKIGSGGFANVFRIRDLRDNQIYALKWISVGKSKKAREIAMREVRMMEKLDYGGVVHCGDAWEELHPNEWRRISKKCIEKICEKREELEKIVQTNSKIVNFNLEVKGTSKYVYFLMEPCTMTLKDWMTQNNTAERRPEPVMKNWIKQLVEVLSYLHKRDIYNNFKNADDIYIALENSQLTLKVGSQGLAHTTIMNFPSSPSPFLDIYSLFHIAAELLIHFDDEETRDEALGNINNNEIPECLRDCSDETKDFLRCCSNSTSVQPILSHQFLADLENQVPESFIQSFTNFAQPIEETYAFLDYDRSIDEDLLENAEVNIRKFETFESTFYNDYVVEDKIESDGYGDLFNVSSKVGNNPYMLRRCAVPRERNQEFLEFRIT